MKRALGLFVVLAAGMVALSPASAQLMGPAPLDGSSANPPLSSRTMTSQVFDPYFSAPPTTGSVEPQGMGAPMGEGMAPPADETAAGPGKKLIAYSSAHVDGPYIAITFDDGPNPETTPKLLKMLKQRGIHATFFVLGSRAAQSPEILRQMVAEGHEIGNHSWSHPQLPKIPRAKADQEIASTSDAIEKATGKKPIYLRPPYGEMTPALRDHLYETYGLTFVYWSVDTLDWKNRDAQKIYDRAMKSVGRGGIILAHDIHATTVAAMPKLLDALLAKGYKFVTISQLIAMDKPQAPKTVAALSAPFPQPKPQVMPASTISVSTFTANPPPTTRAVVRRTSSTAPAPRQPTTRSNGGLY